MKVGDLVKKNFINSNKVVGIITAVRHISKGSVMVAVMWPGCEPFWTPPLHLEVISDSG